MLSWFIAAALILIFELFVGTIYLLVVSAALFGAGLAELLFGQTTISVLTRLLEIMAARQVPPPPEPDPEPDAVRNDPPPF